MSRFDISSLKIKNLKSAIKREFDFKSGSGAVQFNLSKIFSIRDCIEIYNKFNSNLNWIIRDSQKLILPNSQVLYAKKIKSLVDIVCKLIQKNLPEKNLIKLKIETLRVARSDGFQHQVGARWHQDHEAYFSLLINLNSDDDPMSSTRFYHLKPNEKYNLDYLGNPIISNNWKEDYIKPFHLGIFNSGVRYFLFPNDLTMHFFAMPPSYLMLIIILVAQSCCFCIDNTSLVIHKDLLHHLENDLQMITPTNYLLTCQPV